MRRVGSVGLGGVLVAWAVTGCGGGGASSEGTSGTVVVDGSSTVFRISKAAQEAFDRVNPNIRVVVDNHGTGGGFARYLEGEVDIVDASRPAKPEEEARAKAQGLDWTRFLVGYDGISVVVNPKNDFAKVLTVAQLKKLWEPGSKVATWRDLDPSWPGRKIVLYSPDNASGTFEFFTEAIVGKSKSQRKDVQVSPDDNILVQGVARDPGGIGYFGYAYYVANADRLRVVPIQNGPDAKPVAPDPDTILKKTYAPLSRPLFIYVKNSALKRPEVRAFVGYYLSHIEKLATDARYVPPTEADIAGNGKAFPASSPTPAAAPTQ